MLNKKVFFNYFYLIILFSLLLFSCNSNDINESLPQNTQLSVRKVTTYGGSKIESAQSVINTNDGGYAVLGFTGSIDGDITDKTTTDIDYFVTKFNVNDEIEWTKTYGGSADDRGQKIIQTLDGGYALLGFSNSIDEDVSQNEGSFDYWLVKLDFSGNIIWEKSYGYAGSDKGFSLVQTNDGGFFMTGALDVTASGGQGNDTVGRRNKSLHAGGEYWGQKVDSNGNLQWRRYFGGLTDDKSFGVVQTEDNGYIMVGQSESSNVQSNVSNNHGSFDFWVIKINAIGELVWEKSFGGSLFDRALAIDKLTDGNYIVTGETRSNDFDITNQKGGSDIWVLKIKPNGDLIWEKTYGGSDFDVSRSISTTIDGSILISGSSRSSNDDLTENKGQNDAWLLKLDTDGNIIYQKSIGGSSIDFAYDARELNDGSIVIVGDSESSDFDITENRGFTDFLVIRIK